MSKMDRETKYCVKKMEILLPWYPKGEMNKNWWCANERERLKTSGVGRAALIPERLELANYKNDLGP